jgi:hypothetical protein
MRKDLRHPLTVCGWQDRRGRSGPPGAALPLGVFDHIEHLEGVPLERTTSTGPIEAPAGPHARGGQDGDLTHREAVRSIERLTADVLPCFRG